MSTFLSFLGNRQAPQPSFTTSFAHSVPTEVLVTLDTTTHVDPPLQKRFTHISSKLKRFSRSSRSPRASRASAKQLPAFPDTPTAPQADRTSFFPSPNASPRASPRASRAVGKQQYAFPATPSAPQADRTTFVVPPPRDQSVGVPRWYPDNDLGDDESHSGSSRYIASEPEPKTFPRTLFLVGFLCPVFWVVGALIMLRPLRTTPNWEMGSTYSGFAWEMSTLRAIEFRWARRCLIALVVETIVVVIIIVIVKWGMRMYT